MTEKIGLEGVFKTEAFAAGLKTYTGGLSSAIGTTTSVAGAIGSALGGAVMTGIAAFAALGAAAIAAAGIVAGAITKMVFDAAALGDKFSQMSAVTGISTDRLQELSYAGKLLDVDLETITSGLRFLTRNLYAARDGTGEQADAFRTLGISVLDAKGNLRDADVVFGEAIDALGNMKNPTEADAIAMKLMGRSAMELNPLIRAGSAALAEYSDEAHRMGAVISTEDIEALDKFRDQMDAAKIALTAIKGKVAAAFLPAFQEVLTMFRDKLSDPATQQWIADLTKNIGKFTSKVVKWLSVNIPKAVKILAKVWVKLSSAFKPVWNFVTKYIFPLFEKLWTWFTITLPGGIAKLKNIWDGIKSWLNIYISPTWEILKNWFTTYIPLAIAWLVEKWNAVKNIWDIYISPTWQILKTWLDTNIPKAIDWLKTKWAEIKNIWDIYISPNLRILKNWLEKNIPKAIDWLKIKWDELKIKIGEVWDWVNEHILSIIRDMVDWQGKRLVAAVEAAKSAFAAFRVELGLWAVSGGVQSIKDFFEAAGRINLATLNLLLTLLNSLWQTLKQIFDATAPGGRAWSFKSWFDALSWVLRQLTNLWNWLATAINAAITAINKFWAGGGFNTPAGPNWTKPPLGPPQTATPLTPTIPIVPIPNVTGVATGGGGFRRKGEGGNLAQTVNVYNPSPEPASTSVSRELKRLSYMGVSA
jgi:hypothetical protein